MKNLNLHDVFLNQARKERIPVTFFLVNGFQFRGMVKGFDNYTVILVQLYCVKNKGNTIILCKE